MAGLVLGIESVPDGLASGLLAGVNPVAGVYAYLFGMVGGALFTSTTFMTIQGTGAMAIIVADSGINNTDDPTRSLITLSVLTGIVMVLAGLLKLGTALRFVSNSVMTGFISAVGVNIVLGQLDNFTGYEASGTNRVTRAVDLVLHLSEAHLPTLLVGVVTVLLIVLLQRTRLDALGLVVAVLAGSGLAALLRSAGQEVALVSDIVQVPDSLPGLGLPVLSEVPMLIIPAISLAFVGLVQGAGVSAAFPNPEGTATNTSQDFVGQGAGNIVSGIFQGMPVGGSMSGSALVVSAGARSRVSLLYAGVVMALVLTFLSSMVERVAMPALAGLLIVVGVATIKPARLRSVARTGPVPLTVMAITFGLTLILPLQYAVLAGVGISVILVVIRQSAHLVTRRLTLREDGKVEESTPPRILPPSEVVVIQPYGPIFFATATALIEQLPAVGPDSRGSVVILRIRGVDEAGVTMLDALTTYAQSLQQADSKLVVVTDNERVIRQFRESGTMAAIGPDNVYRGTHVMGQALRLAYDDAHHWTDRRRTTEDEDD